VTGGFESGLDAAGQGSGELIPGIGLLPLLNEEAVKEPLVKFESDAQIRPGAKQAAEKDLNSSKRWNES
jgi:hypothetical protein